VAASGAVVDLGQHENGEVGRDVRLDLLGCHDAKLVAGGQRADETVGHVKVGGEVPGIAQDHFPVGAQLQRRGERLVDLDRQRVADHDRGLRRPDQPPDPVAEAPGHVHPARPVPAADEELAPFPGHRPADPRGRGLGERPERVAVEVDQSVGQVEEGARGGEVGHRGRSGRRMESVWIAYG
jgi:hypothetical protein